MEQSIDQRLEAEILELGSKAKTLAETNGNNTVEQKEAAVHQVVGERIGVPRSGVSTMPSSGSSQRQSSAILPAYAEEIPVATRIFVEQQLDRLFHDGDIDAAMDRVRQTKDKQAIDLFHDVLAGKVYEELKNRKIL